MKNKEQMLGPKPNSITTDAITSVRPACTKPIVILSLPSDEILRKAKEWCKSEDEYNGFVKGAGWMSIRLIDENCQGNGV